MGFSDAFESGKNLFYWLSTGGEHAPEYVAKMQPQITYVNAYNKELAKIQQEQIKNNAYADRFAGRYGLTPEEIARQRVNEQMNVGYTMDDIKNYVGGYVPTTKDNLVVNGIGNLTDTFIIGFAFLIVIALFKK